VAIRFGQGLWSDPALTVKADAEFQAAELDTPAAVRAAYVYDTSDGPLVVEIPSFPDSGGSVLLTIDAIDTWNLPDGAGQWDVTLQKSDGDWLRALEGQFSAIHTVSGSAIPYPPITGYGFGPYGGTT
jgi:hypothetical protein